MSFSGMSAHPTLVNLGASLPVRRCHSHIFAASVRGWLRPAITPTGATGESDAFGWVNNKNDAVAFQSTL
jgi:hypothetical protein